MKDYLKKRGLDLRKARIIVHDNGDNTAVSCNSSMKPLKGGSSSVAKPTTEGHNGENSFSSYLLALLLLSPISWHNACRPRSGGNRLKYNKLIN